MSHLPALILCAYIVLTVALGPTTAALWLILLGGATAAQGVALYRRYRA